MSLTLLSEDATIPSEAIEHARRFVGLCLHEGMRYPDRVEKSREGVRLTWKSGDVECSVEFSDRWAIGMMSVCYAADVPPSSFDPTDEAACVENVEWIKRTV